MRLALAVVLAAVCASAWTAAASAQLQSDPRLDAVASGIAGVSVQVVGEDDAGEWAQLVASVGDSGIPSGFTFPLAIPGDPHYRVIYLGPSVWTDLEMIEGHGVAAVGTYESAVAILGFVHEAYHLRLSSTDEGRVNACALAAFPSIVSTYFGVAPTDMQTTTTRVRYRVRVRGRWVIRYRTVAKTQTVANPTYMALSSSAQSYYNSEPPPYSTGVCS